MNKYSGSIFPPTSRRKFIRQMGYLSLGFSLFQCSTTSASENPVSEVDFPSSLKNHPQINAWIKILEDGTVQVLTGKMELGQGITTAILQMAAEELNIPPERINIHLAHTSRTPNEGYTAGSRSIETSALSVRYAAASAREVLLKLAAEKFQKPLTEFQLGNGKITHPHIDREISFADLLQGKQIEQSVQNPLKLKNKAQYQWVGHPVKNVYLSELVQGKHQFVSDLKLPGMVYAQVIRPPGYDSKLINLDKAQLSQITNLVKLVQNGSFLAVVAPSTYEAIQARAKVKKATTWSAPSALPAHQNLKEHLLNLPADQQSVVQQGSVNQDDKYAHTATFFKPYIMHGATGPSCAVALFQDNVLNLWTHSQGVYPLRQSISKMLNLPQGQIIIKGVAGSGCYGHNGADDVAAEAALVALSLPGKPVQLQWTRQDEHGWEPFGSAMIMQLAANLDDLGKIKDWHYQLWSDSHSTRPGGDPGSLLPARYLAPPFQMRSSGYRGGAYRNAEPYYNIPSLQVTANFFQGPLRVSALRSLGAYANIFAIESFMEELAYRANQDPLMFRLAHQKDPRANEVLKKLKQITANLSIASQEGIGYGFSRYKNTATYCGVAARIYYNQQTKHIRLQKLWAVVDAGEIINPDGLKNQIEGGMAQSASWTIKEQVQFGPDGIISKDWTSYPTVEIDQFIDMEVHLIDRPREKPLGAGEAAQGPTAAAIANAFSQASGLRIRDLPILNNIK
ncbi:MAG: molybdopterin cofactor-binding domain-containing protein [Candidatus Cyclobacteriaceae bacterium M3_2C_046]